MTRRLLGLLAATLALTGAGCRFADEPPLDGSTGLPLVPALGTPEEAEAVNPPVIEPMDWADALAAPDLADWIEEGLAASPNLRLAASRLLEAEALARVAGADRLPSVNGQLNARRQKTVTEIEFPGLGETVQKTTGNRFDLGASLAWELDLWGKLRDRARATDLDAEAAEAEFFAARLTLATSIARAWAEALEAVEREAIAAAQVQTAEASAGAIDERYRKGLADALDLQSAQAEVKRLAAVLETTRRQRTERVRILEALVGRYPSGQSTLRDSLPEIPGQPPDSLPADLLTRRPDLRAASRQVFAANRRFQASLKDMVPAINLSASFGTSGTEPGNLLDGDFTVWSLAGGLTQPLFQGGRLRASADRREAQWQQAVAAFDDTLLTALREVESTIGQEPALAREVLLYREAADTAGRATRLGYERYQQGIIGLLDVLELQNRSFLAEDRALSARANRLLNRIDLYAALGGPPPARHPSPESE